jgi:hypothetical protein
MFLLTWLFDKIGYMPKIAINAELSHWPFPVEKEIEKKQAKTRVSKTTAKKVAKPKKKA